MNDDWRQAAVSGDWQKILALLSEGTDIDAKDGYGQTALMLSAKAGHSATVGVLIERGADLDHTAKFGLSALMIAVLNRHATIAGLLVDAGADLSKRGTGAPGFEGKTALQLAQDSGLTDIACAIRAAM